jgi:hypothetical protein
MEVVNFAVMAEGVTADAFASETIHRSCGGSSSGDGMCFYT